MDHPHVAYPPSLDTYLPVLLTDINSIDIHAVLEPPLLDRDADVVPAHLSLPHQPVVGESPVLQAVGPPPLAVLVVPLVPELNCDLCETRRIKETSR